jgi:hypothetical protein
MNKQQQIWDRRTRIVMNEGPLEINKSGFAKIELRNGEGESYEIGLTNSSFLHLPRSSDLEEYYRFPIRLEKKQFEHLFSIYQQIQEGNNWFLPQETVLWKPLDVESIFVNWPRCFGDLTTTGNLDVVINGESMQWTTRDLMKMYTKDVDGLRIKDHKISCIVVEIKPWVRRSNTNESTYDAGVSFAVKKMEIVV